MRGFCRFDGTGGANKWGILKAECALFPWGAWVPSGEAGDLLNVVVLFCHLLRLCHRRGEIWDVRRHLALYFSAHSVPCAGHVVSIEDCGNVPKEPGASVLSWKCREQPVHESGGRVRCAHRLLTHVLLCVFGNDEEVLCTLNAYT